MTSPHLVAVLAGLDVISAIAVAELIVALP